MQMQEGSVPTQRSFAFHSAVWHCTETYDPPPPPPFSHLFSILFSFSMIRDLAPDLVKVASKRAPATNSRGRL